MKLKRKIILLLLLLIPFLLFSVETNNQKKNTISIRFVTENYPPFQIEEPDKPLTGFAVEIIDAMKKYTNLSWNIEVFPWMRAYKMAQEEPNIFIFSIAWTKERENLFKWVGEYYNPSTSIYSLYDRTDIVINSLEDAKKYIIATPRGDAGAIFLENHGFKNIENLYYVVSQDQAIKMLNAKRIDLVVNNEIGFIESLKNNNFSPDKFKKQIPLFDVPMGIATSKATPDTLIENIQKALDKVKLDGTVQKAKKKWFPLIIK